MNFDKHNNNKYNNTVHFKTTPAVQDAIKRQDFFFKAFQVILCDTQY